MSETQPEAPGQQSIDETTADPTGAATSEPSADSVSSPAPTVASPESAPTEHLFRVTHQLHNPGNPEPYSTVTSAPMKWEEVLMHVLAEGAMVGADVAKILATL